MFYLRRNIRDLTSKLIAANGGELSEEMKQALSRFAAKAVGLQSLDSQDRKTKAAIKRQRRRSERHKMGDDRRQREEEYRLDEWFWRHGFDMDEAAIERKAADDWFEKYAQQQRSKVRRESDAAWDALKETYPEAFGHCVTCNCFLYQMSRYY